MRKWLLLVVLILWPAGPAAWAQEAENSAEAVAPADGPAPAAENAEPDATAPTTDETPAEEPAPVDPANEARQ